MVANTSTGYTAGGRVQRDAGHEGKSGRMGPSSGRATIVLRPVPGSRPPVVRAPRLVYCSGMDNAPSNDAAQRGQGFLELWDVLRRLRGDNGCPWDKEQTLSTLTPYLIEEAYEILDAVADDKPDDIAEELGDTLFLIVFCADILADKSPHTLDSLAAARPRS